MITLLQLKNITRKQVMSIGFLLLLVVSLPIALFLSQQLQDIRPRADISHHANFKLGISGNTTISQGSNVTVSSILQLESGGLRVSGVDFMILYDKNSFESNPNVNPAVGGANAFTDILKQEVDIPYDENYNAIHLVLVARKTTTELSGGTVALATITLKSKNVDADAKIMYPQEAKDSNGIDILQVVGIDLGGAGTTPTTVAPSPTVTPGGPTVTPLPSTTPGGPTITPTPTIVANTTVSPTPTPTTSASGLVSFWNFNSTENLGLDSIGGRTATIVNAKSVAGVGGTQDKAFKFDGAGDFLTVAQSDALRPDSVSVSVWMKSSSLTDGYLISNQGGETIPYGYNLKFDKASNTLRFIIGGNTGSPIIASVKMTNVNLIDGKWHHIVATYDSQKMTLYIDGEKKDEKAYSGGITYKKKVFRIGGQNTTEDFYKGVIDNVRIYNKAITLAEVQVLFGGKL